MTVNSEATLPTTSGWACTSKAREGDPLTITILYPLLTRFLNNREPPTFYCRWLFS